MNRQLRITFAPQKITVSTPLGSTILEAALSAGVQVDSVCGGKGKCGKCRVKILAGEAGELTELEQCILSVEEAQEGIRLACQTKVREAMEVMVSEEPKGQGLRGKEIEGTVLSSFKGRVKKKYVDLNPLSEKDQASDLERITNALPALTQPGLEALKKISTLIRPADFKLTFTFLNNEILTVEAGDTERKSLGLAVDLGTTTVAVYLVDLKSGHIRASAAALNKQSPFGADVISRVSFTKERPEGLATLQKAAAATINGLLDDLLANNPLGRENIHLVTMVGNPTMMHLLLGINPQGLAEFPFRPVFSNHFTLMAVEAGLKLPAHTKLEVLPLVSAYVGADMVAAALATGMDAPGPPRLLLDIGTNGEMALAHNGKILACSTAAGPALEGGGIKFGMRAGPGAISAVEITDNVKLRVIGRQSAKGLCGSGLLDAVAQMLNLGLITKTGRFKKVDSLTEKFPPVVRRRLKSGEKGCIFHLTPEVYLTQADINQLQLAKGAMRAGMEILIEKADIGFDDLEEILLAGAFGASLSPKSLIAVGLLPPVPAKKVKAVGNAAGLGAILCLLSEEHHQRALRLARRIEYLELSLNSDFQKLFMEGIRF